MSTSKSDALLQLDYEEAAEAFLRNQTLEQLAEAVAQATQREITLASLALLKARRRDVQYFNELLIQYPVAGQRRPAQVGPDNMVVLHDSPIKGTNSYDVPFQPVGPFWVMEYICEGMKRKDYQANYQKYEQDLRVPYYLRVYPEIQAFTLYRHEGGKYVTVTPNERGRHAVPELGLEVALLDGWVRYWYEGQMLLLPAEMQRARQELMRQADEERRRRQEAERATEEGRRACEQVERATEEARRGREQAERRLEEERQARLALELQIAQLQAQLERPPG